jgi:hypothetical protein
MIVMGRNEWGGMKRAGKGWGGNEHDLEEGPIFWPIYFYPLANLKFLRPRWAAIEDKLLGDCRN